MPVLISPDGGMQLASGSQAQLRWSWGGQLGDDEYFDVRLWRERAPQYGVAWTKDGSYAVLGEPGTVYYWAIAVIHGVDGEMLEQLSAESQARTLLWVRPTPTEPPPTPTEVPPSYGLSLQCSETSKSAPPGQLVVFGVDLANTGTVQDTFDISMSAGLADGWQGMFCISDKCYAGGVHSVAVPAGGTQLVEVKIESAPEAQSGQGGAVTLGAALQRDPSQSASIGVTLVVQ